MTPPKNKPRRFKGFAIIDRRGALLWGTMRPSEKETRALFDKWNPTVDGYDHGEAVASVDILLKT